MPVGRLRGAVATLVATAFLLSPAVHAQSQPPAPTEPDDISATALRQSVTIRATVRRYRIGDATIAEEALPLSYRLTKNAVTIRLSTVPVAFSAASTPIHGSAPFAGRFEYRFSSGDVVRVYGQTASAPQTLDTRQTTALGTVGTPTLDVDALSLGTPALAGVRGAHQMPLGSLTGSVHGAVEAQPRPSGTDPAYWRGTTLRFGGSLTATPGASRLTAELDVSRSFADALGGRNLFPGGGAVSVSFNGNGPIREDSDMFWQFFGFYFRPISSAFPDQPNRLIPAGEFMGVYSSLAIPVGSLLVWPSVEVMREASHTTSRNGFTTNRIEGTGWTTNLGATLAVPLRRGVDLTPGTGYVFGSVGATSITSLPPFEISDSFTDRIRGWWASLELSTRF